MSHVNPPEHPMSEMPELPEPAPQHWQTAIKGTQGQQPRLPPLGVSFHIF